LGLGGEVVEFDGELFERGAKGPRLTGWPITVFHGGEVALDVL
jgi:hypothetical protein